MKTTFDLPDDVMREIKLRAVIQRRTVKDVVAGFLRQGLGLDEPVATQVPSASSLIQIGANGLPVIQCGSKAAARRMNAKKLLQLEQAAQAAEDIRHAGLSV